MLVLVLEGLVVVQAGAEVWTVMPGSLGWLPPGTPPGLRPAMAARAGGRAANVPGHGVMESMAVDIGDKADLATLPRAAEGLDGQAGAPVAAADTDMQHGGKIGRLVYLAHEIGHARILADGIRIQAVRLLAGTPGAQRGMPGRLAFGPVDRVACEQRVARIRQAARLQQVQRRRLQGGGLPLHGQVHAQSRRFDHFQRAGVQTGALRGLRKRLPLGALRQAGIGP
ncbi:hypothetical protein G6F65_019557 [Rhizopus arrhizus]|nr:hypothetical protein G6F65_019557 [Rhizopus arrhizus]